MTAILKATGLRKLYPVGKMFTKGLLHAVDGVDLTVAAGECIGLVGESGCGKSTLARLVARLIPATDGAITFRGNDIGSQSLRRFAAGPERARIQVVFQDPHESLNPGFTALRIVADHIRTLMPQLDHGQIMARAEAAFADVGLPPALSRRYPHQLSGGQKARVGIARAIAVDPELLILDEPTSALDVSVQAVILKLLGELRAKRGMSYIFVSHDLDVIRLICDRVAVMYLGRIIETGTTAQIFDTPAHPYTRALIDGSPDPARRGMSVQRLEGSASSPVNPDPARCNFMGRCPMSAPLCAERAPALKETRAGHLAACHFASPETAMQKAE
ncbi:ABC transporter ATP-binding protein [Falsirhodobacter sp. alg1]|uniref:oligopeptide/dipeptide ABC transporter ATP-binding protein n=1 Tax=Falsirhodobacter sp. alg1 TaxID=1472418 RepID=UPI0005EF504B|nr:ABC transporter ATP-binding protein [Falsirhodobacter sp. alg1]